ncbi:D-alanyl-lipoteichoic acid biosynthesis protein DltD [Thermanaerosceptrum fracticalcis]|uniref:Protein DltD n=1 Tax=Thermanaerosceptrum fracticalcis TaxID=1712410 RepID=A0A7G6E7D0_THEFR|nr:D-alanyl-lipoteichoic acid biosynthesis protein DltD [Thermanaerosceptrum fracticalcis]QNB47984.1 D-alanyl-lipoteichoic acid biosynthesis protein DltD [Thermanaerosceptrum fracticalcis]
MKPRFGPLFLALSLFVIFLIGLSLAIPAFLEKASVEKVAPVLYPPVKMKGLVLQKKALASEEFLPVYGSSELTIFDHYHPSSIFAHKPSGFQPFLVGRGGSQSIIHFLNFAALGRSLEGKKLVFILSPQWFEREGIPESYFRGNFSPLYAYRFVLDEELEDEIRKAGAQRLLEFAEARKSLVLGTLLKEAAEPGYLHPVLKQLVKSLAYLKLFILEKTDEFRSAYLLLSRGEEREGPRTVTGSFWPELLKKAEAEGAQACSNNDFGINDDYFRRHFQGKLESLKGYAQSVTYAESVEFADFTLVLKLLKERKADPLFVMVPVNGYWYDYIGFPKEDRQLHYEKTRELIRSYGFKIADFSRHEYDKFFLRDDMHLGWKGWVYVNEVLDKHHHGSLE